MHPLFYLLKPLFPRPTQIGLRKAYARYQRRSVGDVWPVLASAAAPPPGWRGWPDGKAFALVLTHDVETARGVDRCRMVMDMEERLGFRSAFYFVPERYRVPAGLREEMARRGFEVAVHGLRHDLTLFQSEDGFRSQARAINRYLRDWGASGFRSPYMVRNLDWICRYLDVEYDTSTFDTDPFELQPEGVGTIFPFVVEDASGTGRRCIQLPCTLPQDLTLFVLLGEGGIGLWKKKLEWIAGRGGMALFDTHPDYMQAGRHTACDEYPARFYEEFLDDIRLRFAGQYWHALPREVASFARAAMGIPAAGAAEGRGPGSGEAPPAARGAVAGRRIWIDLDNTPHVPFFKPIVRELRGRGHEVVVTARDAFQVYDLARRMGVDCVKVGRHYGRNRFLKVAGLFIRALQLLPRVLRRRPDLALSHGSRSQLIVATLLRIPSVLIEDYEYARFPPLMRATWRIVPEVIPDEAVGCRRDRIRAYPGIKEDVYVHEFRPDPAILGELGLAPGGIVVVVRPPATEAHYHNPESEDLLAAVLQKLRDTPGVRTVLLPRNHRQGEALQARWPLFFQDDRILIPGAAMEGLNLLWHADLVVSGGGTMNREAAALGVPVYSIFRGAIGAVDRHLADTGRLVLLESVDDVATKLRVEPRDRSGGATLTHPPTLRAITDEIEAILDRPS